MLINVVYNTMGGIDMARQAHNGDIIRVDHTFYAHYGVYVGGRTVIHYTDARAEFRRPRWHNS